MAELVVVVGHVGRRGGRREVVVLLVLVVVVLGLVLGLLGLESLGQFKFVLVQ